MFLQVVGKKAIEQISRRVFQENKPRQLFRKNEHFYTELSFQKKKLAIELFLQT